MYVKCVREDWLGAFFPRTYIVYRPGAVVVAPEWDARPVSFEGLHFIDPALVPTWVPAPARIIIPALVPIGHGRLIEVEPTGETVSVVFRWPYGSGVTVQDWGFRKSQSLKVLREIADPTLTDEDVDPRTRAFIADALKEIRMSAALGPPGDPPA